MTLKSIVYTTALIGLGVAMPAFAQEKSAADDAGEIVVTARRTEERLQDVPISITVFNQAQLTNRNIVTAGDLSTYTPSLTTNSRFGPESTSFAIRGFTQEGATTPSVAVYFADVVAPRANGGTTAGNGAGAGSFFDLQNVQVLKGPQGTLFGRNTTGGAVLLVPQKPTDRFEGYVEGSIGNYDMHRIQGVINAPIAENLRFRLGVDAQERDGYVNNIGPVGPKDFADVGYWAGRASLVWDVTPSIENYTIASYSKSDTNGFYPKVYASNFSARTTARVRSLVTAQLAATNGDFYDVLGNLPDAETEIETIGLINTTSWSLNDTMTLKNIVSYQEFRQIQQGGLFGDYGLVSTSPLTIFNYGVGVVTGPGSKNVQQSTLTEELQLQGNTSDDRFKYQVGIYAEKSEPLDGFQVTDANLSLDCTNIHTFQCADIEGRNAGAEGRVGNITESASEYTFTNLGVYGQGTYKLTDQWSLTAGLRYTSDKTEGDGRGLRGNFPTPNNPVWTCAVPSPLTVGGSSAAVRANPALCNFHREAQSEKPTWLVDIDYKPTDDILLYAKYSRGYRQGSINISGYGLETWAPEKVDAYEIGAKTSFGGPVRGTFNIAAFYNDLSNQQLQVTALPCSSAQLVSLPAQCPFLPAATAGIANAGKSEISGIEIDGSINPLPDLRLDFSYAYLDTKLISSTPPTPPLGFAGILDRSVVGGPLPLTPENKFAVTGTYTMPLDESVGTIAFSATYTYQDESFGNAVAPVGFQFLPEQKNLNLNANWTSIFGRPVDLGLFATNVTEEEYFTNVLGSSFGFDAAILNQPRMYGMRLKYHFGN